MNVEHRGYTCDFREDGETWSCSDLSLEGLPTLKALKSKIDKHLVSLRKLGNVAAIYLHNGWGGPDIRPVTITTIADDIETAVWGIVEKKKRNDYVQRERQKYNCASLALDTPEVRKALKDMQALHDKKEEADALYKAAYKAIPRITAADLKTLAGEHLDAEDK